MKKFKFYAIGFIPGLILVFFILNKKGASCSGYLPNSRVIAESLSKEFKYSEEAKTAMITYKIDEKFIKDSIITNGKVDFDKSHAQKKPCPNYLLTYPEKNPAYEIIFEKCEETVTVNSLKKLK
ncbi:DUF4258 domain-containing protein [Chryseobacterium sp. G0186]|uniref:DUF4258 domain-containing protein n=1 Tax=Chryseobacterium sp. G0186 TaxID=2487064 RepID=UPI000F4F5DF5|nr:DUF4258 domain-containing protein [Chryseobacterium sp. G0186]AZA79893.1 DUF4258 domain-containing protein [Chryseobacterium sp. G0186]